MTIPRPCLLCLLGFAALLSPARAKSIIEARTKNGRFKDWNDFVARNVVPKNAEDAIKDKVRF